MGEGRSSAHQIVLSGITPARIQVGTWITSVFIRHDYACAQASSLIADATGGRFILGLGASHIPVNRVLGVDRPDAAPSVSVYAAAVKAWLRGEGPATHLPQSPARMPVPVYVAALTSGQVERAAAVADGLMPIFWSPERLDRSRRWVARGRAKAATDASFDITIGLPTFIGDYIGQLRNVARENLALYTTFPYYQNLFHASGFEDEAKRMVKGELGASFRIGFWIRSAFSAQLPSAENASPSTPRSEPVSRSSTHRSESTRPLT